MASFTPKMIAVYTSLVAAVESVWPRGKGQEGETWGSVYLPNACGHGLTDRAFAGVLGHLKKHGLFEPSRGNGGADGLFGEVLLSNNYEGLVQWGTPEERAAQGLEPLPVEPAPEPVVVAEEDMAPIDMTTEQAYRRLLEMRCWVGVPGATTHITEHDQCLWLEVEHEGAAFKVGTLQMDALYDAGLLVPVCGYVRILIGRELKEPPTAAAYMDALAEIKRLEDQDIAVLENRKGHAWVRVNYAIVMEAIGMGGIELLSDAYLLEWVDTCTVRIHLGSPNDIQHAKPQKPTPAELRGKAALVTPPGRDAWSVVAGTAPKAKPTTAPTAHDEPIRLTDNPENLITAPVYVYWCRPTQHPQDGLRVLVCINVKEIGTAPQEDDGIRKGWWTTGAGWQIEGLNGSPKWIDSLVLGWCRLPNAPWAAAAGAPATLPHTAQQTLDHYAARKWEDE